MKTEHLVSLCSYEHKSLTFNFKAQDRNEARKKRVYAKNNLFE